MTENQEKQIDDLVKLWKNMPEGKLVLIKGQDGEPSFFLQQAGKVEDCEEPQVIHRITEIEQLTQIVSVI